MAAASSHHLPRLSLAARPKCFERFRGMATVSEASSASSSTIPYPFSTSATLSSSSPSTSTTPPRNLLHPRNGKSLVDHVNASLISTYDTSNSLPTLFSRRHPSRIRPGSVVSVTTYSNPTKTSTSIFSGVLLGIRRRGMDTSFSLRNIVNKTGVELSFKVLSPMIKKIEVIKAADGKSELKDLGRAKVNYLRERPGVMNQIASAVKATVAKQTAGASKSAPAKGKKK